MFIIELKKTSKNYECYAKVYTVIQVCGVDDDMLKWLIAMSVPMKMSYLLWKTFLMIVKIKV